MPGTYTIGRADAGKADILLPGETISAQHAEITEEHQGHYQIRDTGSTNGTQLLRGGIQVTIGQVPVHVSPSDMVLFGQERFTLSMIIASIPHHAVQPKGTAAVSGNVKMRRCLSCGNVTPLARSCRVCGSKP